MAVGELLRTWASGYIRKNELLVTYGPYAVVRNPLYLGSFFIGLGATILTSRLLAVLLYLLLFLPVYLRVIVKEEAFLRERFGEEAEQYFSRVPRLIPFPHLYRSPPERYSLERALLFHREWINWFWIALFLGYAWSRQGG